MNSTGRAVKLIIVLSACANGTVAEERPELVISAPDAKPTMTNIVHKIEFGADSSLLVLGSQGPEVRLWNIGPTEDFIDFAGDVLEIRAVDWSRGKRYFITSNPLQIRAWDTQTRRKVNEIPAGINGWPLSCHESGLCAWEKSNGSESIVVQDLLSKQSQFLFDLGSDVPVGLAFSPDAQHLAVAVNRPVIRLFSLAARKELPSLPLRHNPDDPRSAERSSRLSALLPTMFLNKPPGFAIAVRFAPNGKTLLSGNEFGIHAWDWKSSTDPVVLRGYTGFVTHFAFDPGGQHFFTAGEDGKVIQWRINGLDEGKVVAQLRDAPQTLTIRTDGKVLAVSQPRGQVEFWDIIARKQLAKLVILPKQAGWIVTDPDGHFDTSEGAWNHAAWLFPGRTATYPIGLFFRDFYRPGLLANLLEGQCPPSAPVTAVIPIVPKVSIVAVQTNAAKFEMTPQGMLYRPETIIFRIKAEPGRKGGAVKDLALAHNGIVIRKWRTPPLGRGVASQDVQIEMLPGDNRVTAFAFNENDIRSIEAVWDRPMQGAASISPQRTLHVLAVGVGLNKNPRWKLDFAATDAELVGRTFAIDEATLSSMRKRLIDWNNKQAIETLKWVPPQDVPTKIIVTKLVDTSATREGILSTIRDITRLAKPNDAVIIFYSGHGVSDGYQYYLVPYDNGIESAPDATAESAVKAKATTLISADDLEDALQELNVEASALIFDACQSGQVLEGARNRGPLNPGGLARLAYEKGMHVLAASESSKPAYELQKLGHSVLTLALVQEGLAQGKADSSPRDGRIDLKEWLNYAAARVGPLVREVGKNPVKAEASPVQRARMVPSFVSGRTAIVISVAAQAP